MTVEGAGASARSAMERRLPEAHARQEFARTAFNQLLNKPIELLGGHAVAIEPSARKPPIPCLAIASIEVAGRSGARRRGRWADHTRGHAEALP